MVSSLNAKPNNHETKRLKAKWIFPIILIALLVILVALRLNGSSAAIYDIILYGSDSGDPNLIIGHPRVIRGDEYMVQTPWMISQVLTRSTDVNHDIGNGIDFSTVNIPMFDWTLIFRPLFWGFYLLPLENGFSLYWWGKSFLLVLASYILALKLTKDKILISSFLSLGFLFSPFFQWWYSTSAIEMVAYASILLLLLFNIIDQKTTIKPVILSVGIIYFTFTLFLLFYPAFQLPILYVTLFTFIGYVIHNKIAISYLVNQKKILLLILSVVAVAGLCFVFYKENQIPIEIVRNTVYPGQRFETGGGINPVRFLTGFYNRQLLLDGRELLPGGPGNQSEFSSFFLIAFVLTPWLINELIFAWREIKKINFLLLFLLIAESIIFVWVVFGFPDWIAKYSLLNLSPPNRTMIGFGWLNFLILCVLIGDSHLREDRSKYPALVYSIICFGGFVILGYYFRSLNLNFLASRKLIFFIAFSISLMVFLLIQRKAILFSLCLLLFSLWSSISVNPVFRGLSPYFDSELNSVIQEREILPDQKWVVYGDARLPNYILANGGNIYNGTFFYPDMAYITKFDPENKFNPVYNRYSNILLEVSDKNQNPAFKLLFGDAYSIVVNPCYPVFDDLGINNFVFNRAVDFPCLQKYAEVHEPNMNFYFYFNDLAK